MWDWIRRNYGWEAKRTEWAVLAFGLLLALTVIAALVASA